MPLVFSSVACKRHSMFVAAVQSSSHPGFLMLDAGVLLLNDSSAPTTVTTSPSLDVQQASNRGFQFVGGV